jgi:hypothetical protein
MLNVDDHLRNLRQVSHGAQFRANVLADVGDQEAIEGLS